MCQWAGQLTAKTGGGGGVLACVLALVCVFVL